MMYLARGGPGPTDWDLFVDWLYTHNRNGVTPFGLIMMTLFVLGVIIFARSAGRK